MNGLMKINFGFLADATEPFGDRVLYALRTTVLGIGMVFAVLALLWGVLAISKIVFEKAGKKQEAKKEKAPDVIPQPAVAEVGAKEDDGAVVAAITAAISAMLEEEGRPAGSFRVVSFRRANKGSAWNAK